MCFYFFFQNRIQFSIQSNTKQRHIEWLWTRLNSAFVIIVQQHLVRPTQSLAYTCQTHLYAEPLFIFLFYFSHSLLSFLRHLKLIDKYFLFQLCFLALDSNILETLRTWKLIVFVCSSKFFSERKSEKNSLEETNNNF